MKTATLSASVDVMLLPGPITADSIAHKHGNTKQPPCRPHIHNCDNDRQGECLDTCCCPCDCRLPTWYLMQGIRAVRLGATPCPDRACFGRP